MKNKKSLGIILLGLSFCFVPALGHGGIPVATREEIKEIRARMCEGGGPSTMQYVLLKARVDYVMANPTDFLDVYLQYDPQGDYFELLQQMGREERYAWLRGIDTKAKLVVMITDNRGISSHRSWEALTALFLVHLARLVGEAGGFFDMNADVVAGFYSKEDIPLGYFYQGEYHLWGE